MNFENIDFLKQATELISPSGNEEKILDLWRNEISEYVSDIYSTPLGNVIARKIGSTSSSKKIMITAHADEIGFIITYIDDNGFIYFDNIGGIDANLLSGRIVSIDGINGVILGVIGVKPIHLQEQGRDNRSLAIEDLWIDIHVHSKEDALQVVQIGCVATLKSDFSINNGRCVGKAMDNRCSMAVLLSVAKYLHKFNLANDIYYVATVQEEIRGRGAQTAVFNLNPDICIVVDVTHASDYPSMSPVIHGDIKLNKGVVIALGPNMDKLISQRLIAIAKDKNIKYQLEASGRPTGTDANTIQISNEGIPVGLISIPCRYMHSPVEIIDVEDLEMTTKLLIEFIMNFKK